MAKIQLCLLVAMILVLTSAGCKMPKDPNEVFPLDIWLDPRCHETEMVSIAKSIDKVNNMGQELVGMDLIRVAGWMVAPDEELTIGGLANGIATLSCLYERTEEYEAYRKIRYKAKSEEPIGMGCYGMDVFLLTFNFTDEFATQSEDYDCRLPKNWPDDVELPNGTPCPKYFQSMTTHELGHFIGLPHTEGDGKSMMYPINNNALNFNRTDKMQFCIEYECLTDEYDAKLSDIPIVDED